MKGEDPLPLQADGCCDVRRMYPRPEACNVRYSFMALAFQTVTRHQETSTCPADRDPSCGHEANNPARAHPDAWARFERIAQRGPRRAVVEAEAERPRPAFGAPPPIAIDGREWAPRTRPWRAMAPTARSHSRTPPRVVRRNPASRGEAPARRSLYPFCRYPSPASRPRASASAAGA